jgi:hypothetical protein
MAASTRRWLKPKFLAMVVFISAWIPIPLPTAWLPEGIEADSITLQWGMASIKATQLQNKNPDHPHWSIQKVQLWLKLKPGKSFATIRHLALVNPKGTLKEGELDFLSQAGTGAPESPWENLSFSASITGGQWNWIPTQGPAWSLLTTALQARLKQGQLQLQGQGVLQAPSKANISVEIIANPLAKTWAARFEGEHQQLLSDKAIVLPFLDSLSLQSGSYQFRIEAADGPETELATALNFQLTEASLESQSPPFRLSSVGVVAKGGLKQGLAFQVNALFDETPLEAQGHFQQSALSNRLYLRGETGLVQVNEERLDWLEKVHPETAEILRALGTHGNARNHFSLDWQKDQNLRWAVGANLDGIGLAYQGFLEEDGTRPGFPYPVENLSGNFIATGSDLLCDAQGQLGVGALDAQLAVHFSDAGTRLQLDLNAHDVAMDDDIRHAVQGIEELRLLWEDLGNPQGGDLNLELTLRGDDLANDSQIRIRGMAKGAKTTPVFLPIPVEAEEVGFRWRPGMVAFEGVIHAAQSLWQLQGGWNQGLWVRAKTKQFKPASEERRTLENLFHLPTGMAQFSIGETGNAKVALNLRKGTASPLALVGKIVLNDTRLETPWQGNFYADHLQGEVHLVHESQRTLVFGPQIHAQVLENPVTVSLHLQPNQNDLAFIQAIDFRLTHHWVEILFKEAGLADATKHLNCSATSDGQAVWNPRADSPLTLTADLHPFTVRAEGLDSPLDLHGSVEFTPTGFSGQDLRFDQGDSSLLARDFHLTTKDGETTAFTRLDAGGGVVLGPQLYRLMGPQAEAALTKVGLSGKLLPRNLGLHFQWSKNQEAQFRGESGFLEVENLVFRGPPKIHKGTGTIELQDLRWNANEGTHGTFLLLGGKGELLDIPMRNTTGEVHLSPETLSLKRFGTHLLGGTITSGTLQLGLQAEAPLEITLAFQGLQLDQLQGEVGMAHSLQGNISGNLAIKSPTPNPLDYIGGGKVKIKNGRLATVPILTEIWATLGIAPPIFRKGDLEFVLQRGGKIVIPEFSLDHDLMEVRGKGWVKMDQSVELQVTLRKMLFILGLPLDVVPGLDWVFDLFVKRELSGPLSRLTQTQRSIRKLFRQDLPHKPFPLWVPSPQKGPWNQSPALP